MKNKVLKTIEKYDMLSHEDAVVVGLSGGADSCALLHFLCSLRGELKLEIYACHINHMLRGDEANRDENFATDLCENLGVPIFTKRVCVEELAKYRKIGCEQCGREVRYEFFAETARRFNAKIATAHTASDNAETVLLHMTRGCGIGGLCGIPPVRDNIIRPLIDVSRDEIEVYCRENNLGYVTDSTNLTRRYSRNRIRLDVVPALRQINPSVTTAIQRLCAAARDIDEHMNKAAGELLKNAKVSYGYSAKVLAAADRAVCSRAIDILCRDFVPAGVQAKQIETIYRALFHSGAVELNKSVRLIVKQGILRVENIHQKNFPDQISAPKGKEDIVIAHKKIELFTVNIDKFYEQKKINKFVFNNALDYDKIPLTKMFRTRMAGDTFVTPWGGQTKTLKKLMCELKIPCELRDSIPVLAYGHKVLWIDGIGVSKHFGVSASTRQVLLINTTDISPK